MNLNLKLLIISLLISLSGLAQSTVKNDVTYELGAPYPVIDGRNKQYFHKDGAIIAVKNTRKGKVVQKYDAKSLTFEGVENYPEHTKDFYDYYSSRDKGIIELKDRLFYFYFLEETLFYREIDFEKGAFIGESKALTKIECEKTYLALKTSPDKSKLLVHYRKYPEKRDDDINYDVLGFRVFNAELEEEWQEEVKMPFTEKKMDYYSFLLDSYGNVHILTSVYKDDSRKRFTKDGLINFERILLKISAENQLITQTKIELGETYLVSILVSETSKGKIVCSGFYSDKKNTRDVKGIFVANVSENGELKKVALHEIPSEIITAYTKKYTKDKETNKPFEDLVIRRFITYEDGSVVLVGEQFYRRSYTSTSSSGRTSTSYHHYYNDMFISKITPNGDLAWMKKLPKRQKGTIRELSFRHFYQDGSHFLFFMDNLKNADLEPFQIPLYYIGGTEGYLTAYKIDDNSGEVNKISILNTEKVPELNNKGIYQFTIDRIVSISDQEFVVEFYKKKKEDVLVKIRIE